MTTNFEPNKCLIFLQSTKIGTHENKAIHSNYIWFVTVCSCCESHPRKFGRDRIYFQHVSTVEVTFQFGNTFFFVSDPENYQK